MSKIARWIVITLLLPLLAACSSNPLLNLKKEKLIAFLNAHNPAHYSERCANYYLTRGQNFALTDTSLFCSEYTDQLADAAMREGLAKTVTKLHFRDKKVWKIWYDAQSQKIRKRILPNPDVIK